MTTRYFLIMASIIAVLAAGLVTVLVLAPGGPSGLQPSSPSTAPGGRKPSPHGPKRVPVGKNDTPAQRWQRVEAGLRELRDRRIPASPDSPQAYNDLGWLFLDAMTGAGKVHRVCREQWAGRMQHLLAAPAQAGTAQILAHFRAVASAPLDRSLPPTGPDGQALQREVFDAYLAREADVGRFAAQVAPMLAGAGSPEKDLRPDQVIGRHLLEAYHRVSLDPAVQAVRAAPRRADQAPGALADLINSRDQALARGKLLALVRAHTLWNHYRLDPRRMLALMERLGPLDWRGGYAHAMYWLSLGVKRCGGLDLVEASVSAPAGTTTPTSAPARAVDRGGDELNTFRIWLNCMKSLVWQGRVIYIEPAREGEAPYLASLPDDRFIAPTQAMYDRVIRRLIGVSGGTYEGNILREGHLNWLAVAIARLYADGRRDQAGQLLQTARDAYKLREGKWVRSVDEFVLARLKFEGLIVPRQAAEQIDLSLRAGLLALARGQREAYLRGVGYAKRIHAACQENQAKEDRPGPFEDFLAAAAGGMLLEPRKAGYYLPLASRARLWAALDDEVKRRVYGDVAAELRAQCAAAGLDFGKCFPPAPGADKRPINATRPTAPH